MKGDNSELFCFSHQIEGRTNAEEKTLLVLWKAQPDWLSLRLVREER